MVGEAANDFNWTKRLFTSAIIYGCCAFLFMGLFNFKKKAIPMANAVKKVEKTANGDYWYLSGLFRANANKLTFNMADVEDKKNALLCCNPLYNVVDKAGMMMSRGVPYVVDKDDNESKRYADIKALLENPNPFQTFSSFVKQIEISLKIFGYCPIVLVRSSKVFLPKCMWIVPAEIFHMQCTGKLFNQYEYEEVIRRTCLQWGDNRLDLEDFELALITDSKMIFSSCKDADVAFENVTDSLSPCVNNWVAAMQASNTLMVNGGPKGIVYNDHIDEMGNVALTAEDEKQIKDNFRDKYGIVGKEYPILVSRKKLGWIPLDYNAAQLELHEEDARCTEKICNAIGINANIFTDAKYDNQESAKKAAYQDVIIPDAKKIAQALTKALCPDGIFIKIDFSDVECLQPDRNRGAETLSKLAGALQTLISSNVITTYEARKEASKYIDIDPDKVEGNLNLGKNE